MTTLAQRLADLPPEKRALLSLRLKKKSAGMTSTQSIQRRRDSEAIPLSFAQERLWFLDKLGAGTAYNERMVLALDGPLDVVMLKRGFGEIIRRHESLRTAFGEHDGKPLQVIAPAQAVDLPVTDLSRLARNRRQAELKRRVDQEARQPFTLSHGPLLRARLLRQDETHHILLVTMHHIITDGWSWGVLLRELTVLYEGFLHNRTSTLPELPVQYADFALWQRKEGQLRFDQQMDYWHRQLGGIKPVSDLPTDRPRPAVRSFHGRAHTFRFSPATSLSLRELSRARGVTLFTTLLAAFQGILSRYSGETDIVVGTPVLGRSRSELESLIGVFINVLVLRCQLSGDPAFGELLEQVKRVSQEAFAHQDLPFEKLVDALKPERNLSYSPLFQVMFELQSAPSRVKPLSDLRISAVVGEIETTRFDLHLSLEESEEGLGGGLSYNLDLFDRSTVQRLIEHYLTLLELVAIEPDRPLLRHSLLNPPQEWQLLSEWNDTRALYSRRCLHELVQEKARQQPEAAALTCEDRTLSYGELNRRANQLAHYLMSLGVAPEERVGIFLERGANLLVALLGVLKAGGAYVPLDPAYPTDRLTWILEDACVLALVTQESLLGKIPETAAHKLALDTQWPSIAQVSPRNPVSEVGAQNLAYVIFTSGSTGRPKGVQVPHQAMVNFLQSMLDRPSLSSSDVLLALTTISFDIAVLELFLPLLAGARMVVTRQQEGMNPTRLLEQLEAAKVTTMQATPATWRMLVEAGWRGSKELKALCGGEALPEALAEQLVERTGEAWNMYGPTEATVWSAACRVRQGAGILRLGCPIANTRIYAVDGRLEPAPVGVAGELVIAGDGVTRGYLGLPALTAEKFVPDRLSGEPGTRVYRAGDLVRSVADGRLDFLGRIDHQIKMRGFRIELGEIESALGRHPSVRQAVVLLREDVAHVRCLVAYVVAVQGAQPTADELRETLKKTLPEYMVPAIFVPLSELPSTPNGKVDRRVLPVPARSQGKRQLVEPRSETERVLAKIWAAVLGLETIGIRDNFFELGGDSILSIQIISRAQQAGYQLMPQDLFSFQTVAELAAKAEAGLSAPTSLAAEPGAELDAVNGKFQLVQVDRATLERLLPDRAAIEDLYPLSPLQQGMLFHALENPRKAAYFQQLVSELSGELDTFAFERAWNALIERHPVLRTSFVWEGLREPLQKVWRRVELSIEQQCWRDLDTEEQEKCWRQLVTADRCSGFDLAEPPLMRVSLVRLGERRYRLLWSYHHLLVDGWSLSQVLGEVLNLYEDYRRGEERHRGPSRSFRDYLMWLTRQDRVSAEAFWRGHLKGFSAPTPVPLITLSADSNEDDAIELVERLPRSTTEALEVLARQGRITVNTLLQGAWALLLSRYSGERQVMYGTVTSGRPADLPGVEAMIGPFINTLPFRLPVPLSGQIAAWLRQVQERHVEARSYEHVSLIDVKRWSEVSPESPLFETILVFENYPIAESVRDFEGSLEFTGTRLLERTSYPLTLFSSRGAELPLRLSYEARSFARADMARLMGHLRNILESVAKNPQDTLASASLLSPMERLQMLTEWNDTGAEAPLDICLHRLFEERVSRSSHAVAISFEEQWLTYGELEARANQLARHLRQLGVGPEVPVGFCVDRSLEMMVGLLAILKAGGAYLPLDPGYPHQRLAYMLQDAAQAGPVFLLAQQHLLEVLPQGGACPIELEQALMASADQPSNPLAGGAKARNLAYVIYTSGSTGRPKGIQISHATLVNFLTSMARKPGLDASERLIAVTSLSFDIAGLELFLPLLVGGEVVVVRREVSGDGGRLRQVVECREGDVLQATPVTWELLLAAGWRARPGFKALCGGEALSTHLASRLQQAGATLWNVYGPTETTVWSTLHEVGSHRVSGEGWVEIGRPIGNTELYPLDSELRAVPIGVAGELHIGGVGLARGYLSRPALTAEKFLPDPFTDRRGARVYRTGDQVRYGADGIVEFLGRVDHQVKIRGFRIELGEIEGVLGACDEVREAVVIARKDQSGDRRLVAYVVPHAGCEVHTEELRAEAVKRLTPYMVPSAFVVLAALPLTPNGKINRKALPPPGGGMVQEVFVAPRTPVEELLADLWSEILGVERPGIHESFFELGGHSLLALRIFSRLRGILGINLSLESLFEAPTIAKLAERIHFGERVDDAAWRIEPAPRSSKLPLSFAQQQIWVLHHMENGGSAYNSVNTFELRGDLDVVAVARGLRQVVERHEVLRTVFPAPGGVPIQKILSLPESVLTLVDLRGIDHVARRRYSRAVLKQQAARGFELATELPFRAVLLRLDEDDYVLEVVVHHIAFDGWSRGLLFGELATLYTAFRQERPSPLPPMTVQYADFAVWQRARLIDENVAGHLAFWRRKLAGLEPLSLKADPVRAVAPLNDGASEDLVLPLELTEDLRQLSRREGSTVFVVLLALFKVVLIDRSGRRDIAVGSPVAGRTAQATEQLIGDFVNTLVLRSELRDASTFREVVAMVHKTVLEAQAHQEMPFEKLVSTLREEGNLANANLFNIWFVLHNTPAPKLSLPGLSASVVPVAATMARHDLRLSLWESPEGIRGAVDYRPHLFRAATVRQLIEDFLTLAAAVVERPGIPLMELASTLRDAGRKRRSTKRQTLKNLGLDKLRQRRRVVV